VCIVLRLARFNALLDSDQPLYTKDYFVGMPAPAGAIGAIGPLAAKMQWPGPWWSTAAAETVVIIWMVAVSLLVVSRIPMRKIHTFTVSPNMVAPLLAGVAIIAAGAFVFPYLLIMLIIAAYVLHMPFAMRSQRWAAAHPESWEDTSRQRRAARRAASRAQHPHRRSTRLGLRKPGG
jgi:CDP-diacylglycerol--serine O-phosphatidyltransferase